MHKALVVDDNADLLFITAETLRTLGYAVTTAPNSEEALALLSKDREFDVMVTDVVMPGASGIDLAHRAQRLVPELKIVLTSGFLPSLQIPAPWSFLPKPFTMRSLTKVLSQ